MASRFVTVSKDNILAVNKVAAPANTKKETKFGLSYVGVYRLIEKNFLTESATKS